MEREGKVEGGGAEKEEKLVEKLRRGVIVGKRCGPTTPVLSSWRLFSLSHCAHTIITKHPHHHQDHPAFIASFNHGFDSLVSARQLGAALWDLLGYFPTLAKMHRGAQPNGGGPPPPPPPRLRHVSNNLHHHRLHHKDKGVVDLSHFLAHDNNNSLTSDPDQPASATSLRRHLVASLMMQHHRTAERNDNNQPVSPASYGSSMEVAPYDPAVTPTSSLDFRGRVGESQYNLKTSTELIKVLNRIWSLEEQHASNMKLIKALKTELDHSRAKIKELLRERQSDRHEIDDLVKQIAEDKLSRKDRIHAAVHSAREELEDERRLRKRSETLHRKLARDLSEAKAGLSGASRELERERGSRKLLEDLCDEFAGGIKDYEREVHFLRQKANDGGRDRGDRLILHVSESWLDERAQTRIEEARCGVSEKGSIVDKLRLEIETFLRAKHAAKTRRRNSMESVPLIEPMSAPRDDNDDDDDEDSLGSGSHCFELQKPGNNDEAQDEAAKPSDEKKKLPGRTPSTLQVKFEEKMARVLSSDVAVSTRTPEEVKNEDRAKPDGTAEPVEHEEARGASLNYAADSVAIMNKHKSCEASCSTSFGWRNQPSPVRQWMAKLNSPDLDTPETSSKPKLLSGSKDNTLKAKLMEARSKGRKSRPRASKAP